MSLPETPSETCSSRATVILGQYRRLRIAGETVYPSRTARVPAGGVDQGFVQDLGNLITLLAAPNPPEPTPSPQECARCDLGPQDCPQRIHAPP